MTIFTNRLEINFNIDAIKEDFAFIRLTRDSNKNWYGAAELDYLIGQDFNAAAVMSQDEKYAYAMFNKPIDVYQLLHNIRNNKEFDDNAVIEVVPKAICDKSEECICEAWLGQILLNSLSSSKSRFAKFNYSNLTGSLLLVPDFEGKNKAYLDIAKITLTSEYFLKVETVRYRTEISIRSELKKTSDSKRKQQLQNALEKPKYIFEASTGSLRRYFLQRDGEVELNSRYIKCGLKGKKASKQFLDFSSTDNFEKSRAGILHKLISTIQADLSKYMDVKLSTLEIEDTIELNNTLLQKPEKLRSLLDGELINIVDTVNNEESRDLVTQIKTFLHPQYVTEKKNITCRKRDKDGALNLRIIHDADYYERMKLDDEYRPSTKKTYRQHITIESIETTSDAVLKTILKELLIKRDISHGKFNLFDWNNLQLKGMWTFAAWDEDAEHVVFMEIQPDGSFECHQIHEQNLFNYQEFQKYIDLMIDDKSGKKLKNLEGLVESNTGDINRIFRTDEVTIPNLDKIEDIIKEVKMDLPQNKQTGSDLANLIKEFMTDYFQEDSDKLVALFDELQRLGNSELDKERFRILLNNKLGKTTKVAREFREYLVNQHQIRLSFPKQKETLEDLFDASLNIKYFSETEEEAYYFVGGRRENVQFSFKDACHVRRIAAVKGSKLIFRQLLPTMDVDFVRTGQSTVIPFPFKYIREYKNFDVAN
ncbi:MAG: hypothetical protein QNJ47_06905 [Nostocaceae cyanobacterium]|nr:hypothetical protein [Nostocaceae cyanobacterium]